MEVIFGSDVEVLETRGFVRGCAKKLPGENFREKSDL